MTDEIEIYVWADYTWYYVEDVDIDEIICHGGMSDDFIIVSLPDNCDTEEDIEKYITDTMNGNI